MAGKDVNTKEYYTIDLMQILRALWYRAWLIVLAAVIGAAAGFSYAKFMITPTYSSSIMLYVNNTSFSMGNANFSISSSQIVAAQSLVKTYSQILDNRTTLERVIEKAGVSYNYRQLSSMITSGAANETEIMKVTVVSTDPYEAALIANSIAEVLPVRISEIIDGASMEVVDTAVPNLGKIAPSITKYTAIGMFLGAFLVCALIAVMAILDDTIHDEEYILQTYNYPILAKIPDLLEPNTKKHYGYSSYQRKRSDQNNGLD